MHNCTSVRGYTASMASGNPFSPSTHAIKISFTPRVHRDDLVVEPRPARLALGHDLGIERGLAVAWSFQIQLAKVPFQSLGAFPVTRVAPVVACRIVLLIAKMIGHLGLQCPLQDG